MCVRVLPWYLSKLPDDAGGRGLLLTGAVPHADGRLSADDLGAELRHRVEADFLPGRVLKVLRGDRK